MAALLTGCATPQAPSAAPDLPWQDAAFAYDPAMVKVTTASLFELDPTLSSALHDSEIARAGERERREHLLKLVFGEEMKAFQYAGGHSTPAAETWRNRRGDCLSLSILSVALARALHLKAQVQEVRVPVVFDRRGGIDFLNLHVNVLMRNDAPFQVSDRWLPAGDVVVDFEPQPGSRQRGVALSDAAVLARFLNNRAAEHLAASRDRLAYAHFKAAIVADPAYAAAYSNLAQLYLRAGLDRQAEALLRLALMRDSDSYQAMVALHRLLLGQGRSSEAQALDERLVSLRERDPYYWLGLGIDQLQRDRPAQAARALERAQELTTGFDEVHRFLAIAYWRTGQLHKARDQLATLTALGHSEGQVAKLSRKLDGAAEGAQVHY